MESINLIGLDKSKSKELAEELNVLLANYSIFYQNTRGFHWNIQGHKFFELHLKFEELYDDLLIKIDEIAERILTLGYSPKHNYSEYIRLSEIKESPEISNGIEAMEAILQSFQAIVIKQRDLLLLSDEADDEGTNALMSDYIRGQEKLIWMYSSFLKER